MNKLDSLATQYAKEICKDVEPGTYSKTVEILKKNMNNGSTTEAVIYVRDTMRVSLETARMIVRAIALIENIVYIGNPDER